MDNQHYIERYWRDATPADAIKEPPMVARFRDKGELAWKIDKLISWDRSDDPWVDENHWTYDFCQVYDTPDPGEGWRLIDVWEEAKQEGDEFWSLSGKWKPATLCKFYPNHFYRRRIEQPKPEPKYVPFTWDDREQLRGRWIVQVGYENTEQMINKMDFCHNEFYANNKTARQLLDGWRFLASNEPVGRRVEP